MTEMSLTANRLIIIGQGRLIEDASMADLLARFQSGVLVRSPHAARLSRALEAAGATIRPAQNADAGEELVPGSPAAAGAYARPVRDIDAGEELLVTGLTAAAIGDIALANGCTVHELVSRRTSLEEAFMEITQ
jgi:ABC-2 type transport system ATP-binding protein